MTYVFSIAALLDTPGAADLAAHGVTALRTVLHDDEHGGWFDAIQPDGTIADDGKRCYGHAFVLLAGATATSAGILGATHLFAEAREVHAARFWDAGAGRCVEEWSRDWSSLDDYRGANSNMHTVEAYLFTADATGEAIWLERAEAICERIIAVTARAHNWRIPEHFDSDWSPVLDLNRDRPDDPFRPFGATPGHAFEWARLMVQLDAALDDTQSWRLEAAEHLFARAIADAVDDDMPLLPYTTDWEGEPVVRRAIPLGDGRGGAVGRGAGCRHGRSCLPRTRRALVVRDRRARDRRRRVVATRAVTHARRVRSNLARTSRRLPWRQRVDVC